MCKGNGTTLVVAVAFQQDALAPSITANSWVGIYHLWPFCLRLFTKMFHYQLVLLQ